MIPSSAALHQAAARRSALALLPALLMLGLGACGPVYRGGHGTQAIGGAIGAVLNPNGAAGPEAAQRA